MSENSIELEGGQGTRMAEIETARRLNAAYTAGRRVAAPNFDEVYLVVTGNPAFQAPRQGSALRASVNGPTRRLRCDR